MNTITLPAPSAVKAQALANAQDYLRQMPAPWPENAIQAALATAYLSGYSAGIKAAQDELEAALGQANARMTYSPNCGDYYEP